MYTLLNEINNFPSNLITGAREPSAEQKRMLKKLQEATVRIPRGVCTVLARGMNFEAVSL